MNTRRRLLHSLAAAGGMAMLQRVLAAGGPPLRPGLRRLRGTVAINGRPAREGEAIRPGDRVVTGPGAEAVYVIDDNAFLQRENSEIRFGADLAADFLRVVTGKLLSVFGRGDKRLITGTATIGIRGTACYIEEEKGQSYFCLCYGEAEVVPKTAPQERVVIRTRHHDHPIFIHADTAMPTSMVPATVINHADAELILLENLVGRWPPFYGSTGVSY